MLTLAISTSSGQFALVIGEATKILFDSTEHPEMGNELDDILFTGLFHCNRTINDIKGIIVDIGPGGTSRVRTGIAFANSLAYSLGIPVCPVPSMKLAGIEAWNRFGHPVIHSVKSIKGNAYIGLYTNDDCSIQYGRINEVVPLLVSDFESFTVVGAHRDAIMLLASLSGKTIIDSGMSFGNARFMIEKCNYFSERKSDFPTYAQPVTEKTV